MWVALSFVPILCALPACGDDDEPPYYDDGVCEPGDPFDGRDCECRGDECICPSTGDCAIYCVDQCTLQCAGSGSCDFLCEAACSTECTGSGNCNVEVADDSTVACTASGDCDVLCHGECTVICSASATCRAQCAPNAECRIEMTECLGEVEECGDGALVCNGACA